MASAPLPRLSRQHQRRLRTYYRSAGWPCLDAIEIDLLAAGLIVRESPAGGGPDTIRVTEAGMAAIAETLDGNRRALHAHDSLARRVADHLAAQGRLAFRGLMLRGNVGDAWRGCRPDVYSIRNTTRLDATSPVIHEVKVSRADLLADIADSAKRSAYQALSSEFYYVMPEGLAGLAEVPFDCGVLYDTGGRFSVGRPSEHRPVRPGMQEWMAMVRRGAERSAAEDPQLALR
jgi:hypothetical protein